MLVRREWLNKKSDARLILFPGNMDGGLVFQISEEDLLYLKMIADINQKITEKEIRDTLFRVGLDLDDQRKYKKYSLGMKQRLGIAAAVMEKPDLLILDEPFNALDTSGIEMVSHLLEEEKKNGALVIFSCHDNEVLKMHSDQILELSEGRMVGESDEKEKDISYGCATSARSLGDAGLAGK